MARTAPGQAAGKVGHRAGPRVAAGRRLLTGIGAVLLVVGAADAESLNPKLPQRFVTALPVGNAVSEGLTPTGTNQTLLTLPDHAQVGWQVRLAAPILHAPLALSGERLLVAHGRGRLSELDRAGRTVWSLRTGAELIGSPIALGSGERLALTRNADVIRVSAAGRELGRERLPIAEIAAAPVSIPTTDGGALVGLGARVVRLGPRGSFAWTTTTSEPVRALFEWRGYAVVVGRNGSVHLRPPVGELRRLTNLAVGIRAALRVAQRLWLLTVDQRLIEFNLESEKHVTRFSEPSLELAELASGPSGNLRLLTRRGLLLGVDASGRELGRSPLLPDTVGGEATALVLDGRGAALAAFAGAALVFVTPQGDSSAIASTACPEPLRPTPLGPGLVVAACRSGLLRALSDKAR